MTSVLVTQAQVNVERLRWLYALAHLSPTGECIDWPWSKNTYGYGRVTLAGREQLTTHVVLIACGMPRPAPPGDQALHSCDRPICVAPWHLRWGTQKENIADADARGRMRRPVLRGEAHGRARLTSEQVADIRERHAAGSISQAALAREYGVGKTTIHHIISGRNWPTTRQEETTDATTQESRTEA